MKLQPFVEDTRRKKRSMSLGMYGILVIFGAFVILMIINPNLSCFGKKLRSPVYPLVRRKKMRALKAEDYGFDLDDLEERPEPEKNKSKT
jgi:hypothetical protein